MILRNINHLKKFNKSIGGNVEPKIRNRVDSRIGETSIASIRLFSKKMYQDLCNKGCVERKTDKIQMPDIDEKYMIDSSSFESMGKNTPFNGFEVYGKVIDTIVNGKIVEL